MIDRTLKIRRSGAYGIAGTVVLLGSLFLPMSTPEWCAAAVFLLAFGFAGGAFYFNAREKRAGATTRSIGFFSLAVTLIIFAVLFLLPLL
jgi:hypothetical protein